MTQFKRLGSPEPPKSAKKTVFQLLCLSNGQTAFPGGQPDDYETVTLIKQYARGQGYFLAVNKSGSCLYHGIVGDEFGPEPGE